MLSQHAFERGAEPFDRAPAALVALVGADRDPTNRPDLEGVGKQEQLRLGVDGCPPGIVHEPGSPDLDFVGITSAERPGRVHEAGAADHPAVARTSLDERRGEMMIGVVEKRGDVSSGLVVVRRNVREAERRPVARSVAGARTGDLVDVADP